MRALQGFISCRENPVLQPPICGLSSQMDLRAIFFPSRLSGTNGHLARARARTRSVAAFAAFRRERNSRATLSHVSTCPQANPYPDSLRDLQPPRHHRYRSRCRARHPTHAPNVCAHSNKELNHGQRSKTLKQRSSKAEADQVQGQCRGALREGPRTEGVVSSGSPRPPR